MNVPPTTPLGSLNSGQALSMYGGSSAEQFLRGEGRCFNCRRLLGHDPVKECHGINSGHYPKKLTLKLLPRVKSESPSLRPFKPQTLDLAEESPNVGNTRPTKSGWRRRLMRPCLKHRKKQQPLRLMLLLLWLPILLPLPALHPMPASLRSHKSLYSPHAALLCIWWRSLCWQVHLCPS